MEISPLTSYWATLIRVKKTCNYSLSRWNPCFFRYLDRKCLLYPGFRHNPGSPRLPASNPELLLTWPVFPLLNIPRKYIDVLGLLPFETYDPCYPSADFIIEEANMQLEWISNIKRLEYINWAHASRIAEAYFSETKTNWLSGGVNVQLEMKYIFRTWFSLFDIFPPFSLVL